MASVLLFHHAQGQTEGFLAFAKALRSAGHLVHTPDLFDGQTFDELDQGVAYVDEVGLETLLEQGVDAAGSDDNNTGVVYAGFSLGVLPAQKLAQTRTDARGALFFESCVPATTFGETWPLGLAVQVHGMSDDPFFAGEGDIDAARTLVEGASDSAIAELFVYEGSQHLFADSSLPSYNAEATALLLQRVLSFLGQLDDQGSASSSPTSG